MARALALDMGPGPGAHRPRGEPAGAGGNIAAEAVPRRARRQHAAHELHQPRINASLYPSLPFDPQKDFTPLTMVSTSPALLGGQSLVPANNLRELIALAKSRPGKLNFALGASAPRCTWPGEAFKMMSGTYIVNIPYKGTSPGHPGRAGRPGGD
jgi:tripartite-type tricarboxylate transporter receptor subunit TctC